MKDNYGGVYRKCPVCVHITCKLVDGNPVNGLWKCEYILHDYVDGLGRPRSDCPGYIDERITKAWITYAVLQYYLNSIPPTIFPIPTEDEF